MPIAGVPYSPKIVSARAASTANVTLTAPGTTIDGVTLAAGNRVLLKDQTTASQNGVYDYNGSAVSLTRSPDAGQGQITDAFSVRVQEGTANAETRWELTTADPITVGTTSLTFVRKDWSEEPWTTIMGPFAAQFGTAQAATTSAMGLPVAAGPVATGFSLLTTSIPTLRIDPADYVAPTGRTLQWRVIHSLLANTVAPGTVTFTAGLYPVTPAGATGALTATIGTVVTGSTAAIASPGASANTRVVSATFTTALTAAHYILGVVTSAAMATNAAVRCQAVLQLRFA